MRNTIIVPVMAAVLIFAAGGAANGHSWYDPDCCSNQDCFEIGRQAVISPAEGGYLVTVPGRDKPVFFSRSKIRASQDGSYHVCIAQSGMPFCLYVPLGS